MSRESISSEAVAEELACRPISFAVGRHAVVVAKTPGSGRWVVTVDGRRAEATFESQVDAWAEGVRAADHLDHPAVR